jgi:hypothetical protein
MSPAVRAERGAAAMDAVYGAKWFRTESLSLGAVKRAGDTESLANMLFFKQGDTYESFTEKLKAKHAILPGSLLPLPPEIDGEIYGFYGNNDDEPALAVEWQKQIRQRRYNRPAKRRVSSTTAQMVRTGGKAVSIGV